MRQRRTKKDVINHLHEQCLKTVCNDKHLPFEHLLEKYASVITHQGNCQGNWQFLVNGMLNIVKGIFQFIINVLRHWNEEKKKLRNPPGLNFQKWKQCLVD